MASGHDSHDSHDSHGSHDSHDDHGDHGSGGDAWVLAPLVVGLVIWIIIVAVLGLDAYVASVV